VRLDEVKAKLDALKASTDAVRNSVDKVDITLTWGLGQLVKLGIYANQALAQNAKQNDTIICLLEHISHHTCQIWNESHLQTGLQTVIKDRTVELADLYEATHAEAALEWERMQKLKKQMEECCPPEPERPPCQDERCPKPDRLPEPPHVEERPPRPSEPK
jgi:hypothetical protein